MQIETGKYYKTRDGRKVGPAVYRSGEFYPWLIPHVHGDYYYNADGTSCINACSDDVIEEWQDELDHLDLAALAAQHGIKITVQVGEVLIEYDGRTNPTLSRSAA